MALMGRDRILDFIINHLLPMKDDEHAWKHYLSLRAGQAGTKVLSVHQSLLGGRPDAHAFLAKGRGLVRRALRDRHHRGPEDPQDLRSGRPHHHPAQDQGLWPHCRPDRKARHPSGHPRGRAQPAVERDCVYISCFPHTLCLNL